MAIGSSRYWHAAIVDSSDDAIISTDLRGTITTWNRAATTIFWYQPEEVIGRPVFLLAAPGREEEMPRLLARIGRGERIEHYETERRRKDGAAVNISLTCSPIRDNRGGVVGVSKIARDIGERGRAKAELRRLNETLTQSVADRTAELQQANEKLLAVIGELDSADRRFRELQLGLFHATRVSTLGRVAGVMAHELNQPLTAASSSISAARRLLAGDERARIETIREILREAAAAVLRSEQIIRRLRDFIRPGETARRIESVATMVEEASSLALTGAEAAGIQARFRLDPGAKQAFADRIQVEQVLVNLMRNAIEAMAESERRDLEVATRLVDEQTVEIAVADSGSGIPGEAADRLFEPFISSKPHGMGLGLSICRSIIEAHGGRLWSEPNRGGGAVFRFTLAAAPNLETQDGQ